MRFRLRNRVGDEGMAAVIGIVMFIINRQSV